MTQVSRTATSSLRADAHRRQSRRDAQLFLTGAHINRWTASLERELLGIVAAGRGGFEGVIAATDVVLSGALQDGADIQEEGLQRTWDWAWLSVTASWVESLPIGYWLQRLVPIKLLTAVDEGAYIKDVVAHGKSLGMSHTSATHMAGGALRATNDFAGFTTTDGHILLTEAFDPRGDLEIENQWRRILDGLATEAEAREIIRLVEFGTPTPEEVDAILNATSATDGLSAMERIRTVGAKDIDELRQAIRTAMSGEIEGASAVESLSKAIKPLLSENAGLNYKAKRIARTEGVRVSQASMTESWRPLGDMLAGIQAWTAGDSNVRDSHRHFHGKMYHRVGGQFRFVATDGEPLPEFPVAPNCRGYTSQVLIPELTQGLPEPVFRDSRSARNAV